MESSIWSSNGRISRRTFWLRWLAAFGINIGVSFILGFAAGLSGVSALTSLANLFGFVVSIFVIVQGVKRMHDVSKSGWYLLIPIYSFVLLCTAGTQGANEYGDDPLGLATAELQSTFQ